ncbi:unnamed protein product [Clavelina lepadiformis]|uniref:Uncharacterized protein n=1 Tax=Clavelina lepadiformis TaxID=159417 RepID=A0ABP0EXE4_CLALP
MNVPEFWEHVHCRFHKKTNSASFVTFFDMTHSIILRNERSASGEVMSKEIPDKDFNSHNSKMLELLALKTSTCLYMQKIVC